MTTILGTVAIIALLWTALSALPAGLEARMPLPYMIALTPLLWVPLVVLAAFAAWQREWSVMSLLIVAALFASSHRLNYWGTSIDPAGKRKESHRETPRETSANTQNMNNSGNADTTVTVSSSTIDANRETSRETSVNTHNISDSNAGPSAATSSSGTASTSREALDAASNLSSTASESTRTTLPTQFTVMTLNCRYGRADANDIIANIRKRGISVLALQEVTDELIARLTEAGLNELLPYHQFGEAKDTDNGGFNVLYSAYEPGASVPNVVSIPAADVPAITLRIADQAKMPPASTSTNGITIRIAANPSTTTQAHPDRTITFCSAHPKSPMRGCADWSAGILGLREITKARSIAHHNIAVVMGDLNSSTDHPSFRALLKSGFKDASLTQAAGPNLTFPRWLKWPRIELDHVLFTPGVRPSQVKSVEIKDTDHLALVATLALR